MNVHHWIKARLAVTRSDLDQVVTRLADSDMRWAPAPGMKTVAGLLLEIADKDREIVGWLRDGAWPDDDPPAFDPEAATLVEAVEGLRTTRRQTWDYVDSLSDEEIDEVLDLPELWWESLRLPRCPRSEMLRNISAHEWYHTGQLVTYLWSRSENPETW